MAQIYLTPGGLDRLRNRIDDARARYQAVVADNPAALESGDTSGWHDNFAFEDNQREMHRLARRIRDLEAVWSQVSVVPLPRRPERAILGAQVRWRYLDETEERSCWIAGFDDGDPDRGRISYNSPLGAALLGAEPGDERTAKIGDQQKRLEILDIAPVAPMEDHPCLAA